MYTAGGLICKLENKYFNNSFTKVKILVGDITSGKYKTMAVCLFEQFWSIGLMLLPAVASYWPSWTYLYMVRIYKKKI